MEFMNHSYVTPEFEKEVIEANNKYLDKSKELYELLPNNFKPVYNLWDFDELANDLTKVIGTEEAKTETLYLNPRMNPSKIKQFKDLLDTLVIYKKRFFNWDKEFKVREIGEKVRLSKYENIMDLLKDKKFSEYFPPNINNDIIDDFNNPLAAMIKAYANGLVAKAIRMQLHKEDPDHVDEGMLFTFRSPIYKMFEYIETSELYKAANVMQMKMLEELEDVEDPKEFKDKIKKLDGLIDDEDNIINDALNKFDEYYEQLPLLFKYGLIVYKISEDPETQEFNNKGSNLFCEMLNAMLGPNRLDPEKYVEGMLNVSIKGLETLSEMPDQYKKFQDLFDQIPGLKLVEPIEYYNQIEALNPIPSIPMIVEAAIFSHHISDF